MPNHSREEQERDAKNLIGTIFTMASTVVAGAIGIAGMIHSHTQKESLHRESEQLQNRIHDINGQIGGYKNRFLGEMRYSSEIEALEAKRKEQVDKKDAIDKKLKKSTEKSTESL